MAQFLKNQVRGLEKPDSDPIYMDQGRLKYDYIIFLVKLNIERESKKNTGYLLALDPDPFSLLSGSGSSF